MMVPLQVNSGASCALLVEYHELGIVIRKPAPIEGFTKLLKQFEREGFKRLSIKLCGPLDAVAVLTKTDEDAERWASEIDGKAQRNSGGDAELAWICGTDTGTSSLTIFSVLAERGYLATNKGHYLGNPPWDPDDFGRCYRLLELFPQWRGRLREVAAKHKAWRGLVDNWSELESLYMEELPKRTAPKLYERMKELLK